MPSPVVSMLSYRTKGEIENTKGEYAADDQPMPRIKFEFPNQEYSTLSF